VVADACRPLRREALPRHGALEVVEAVAAVRHKASICEHAVLADLDQLDGGKHDADVEEAAAADSNASCARCREPDVWLKQCVGPDLEASFAECLEDVAMHRPAHEGLTASELPINPGAVPRQ